MMKNPILTHSGEPMHLETKEKEDAHGDITACRCHSDEALADGIERLDRREGVGHGRIKHLDRGHSSDLDGPCPRRNGFR